MPPPTLYLSCSLGNGGSCSSLARRMAVAFRDAIHPPALLVSFVYLPRFQQVRDTFRFRHWALDSGAYSFQSGTEVNLADYIAACAGLLAEDPLLREVFALDVIKDWRAGVRNAWRMWDAGVPAIPTYHAGEPWGVLRGLAADFPKIAISPWGMWHPDKKTNWVRECLERVWPKPVHGFAFGSAAYVLRMPLHSTDSTNWYGQPLRMARWYAYGRNRSPGWLRTVSTAQYLGTEANYYLDLEAQAQAVWGACMDELRG